MRIFLICKSIGDTYRVRCCSLTQLGRNFLYLHFRILLPQYWSTIYLFSSLFIFLLNYSFPRRKQAEKKWGLFFLRYFELNKNIPLIVFSKVEKIQIERQYHQNHWKHWVKIQSLKKRWSSSNIENRQKNERA